APAERIVNVGWELSDEKCKAQLEELLCSSRGPCAVFAWYDEVAIKLLQAAREWGLKSPEDLSVVGFDSTQQCELTSPRLTSVRQPIREMADCATTMLIRRINGEPVEEIHHVFKPTLDVRDSCAPVGGARK
ncbi:MAG: substrate-binding domain-containing protein, partial [Chloroflexi bacterium]|nr:substrate-binding domain-containing protein [Chloroflexota bacterium]